MERNQKDVLKADGKVQKYETPPILDGYKYVSGKWNNGFIIERIQDESQFVWIPVGWLDSNGTFDGSSFTEKFGSRNYQKDELSEVRYHEKFRGELALAEIISPLDFMLY